METVLVCLFAPLSYIGGDKQSYCWNIVRDNGKVDFEPMIDS